MMEQLRCRQLMNDMFLKAVKRSFDVFIDSGTSRSSAKLKPLHGAIAADIAGLLGWGYSVFSQGYGADKEKSCCGRYYDKRVDIAILRNGRPVAAIGVKFVMQNYSQNSNNYFENMLGETANLRSARLPYFQVFIALDKLPYYDEYGNIKRFEELSEHNISKYIALSNDDADVFYHTPNKTLVYVVHIPEPREELKTKAEYFDYYASHDFDLALSTCYYGEFGSAVILNDYALFMEKLYHAIMAM